PVQRRRHKVHHRFVRSFAPQARYSIAGLLLLPAPQVYEYHQAAGFHDLRVQSQGPVEGRLSLCVVFRPTQSVEHPIRIAGTQSVKRESKGRVELSGALEPLDGSIAILPRNRAKDEPGKEVAASKILFVCGGVVSSGPRHIDLFVLAQLQTKSICDSLRDGVLQSHYVGGGRVYSLAPQDQPGADFQQL